MKQSQNFMDLRALKSIRIATDSTRHLLKRQVCSHGAHRSKWKPNAGLMQGDVSPAPLRTR